MTLSEILKRTEKLVADNSPAILTAVGVTGVVTTAFLAGRASFKAARLIDDYEDQIREGQRANLVPDFSTKEKIQVTWKLYIPAVGTGILSITAIILANRIGTRRAAAVAAAYSLSEKAFAEYKTKVVEKIGTHKDDSIRAEVAQDRVNANPISSREVIITGNGDVLCYDSITGRYFNSNIETLRKAQNDINKIIIQDMYASLYDFYTLIQLPPTPYSNEVGWNVDGLLELEFSTVLAEDGRPCISLDYRIFPIREYHRLQ